MSGELLDALRSPSFDHGPSTPSSSLAPPTALDWDLNSTLQQSITRAQSAAHTLVSSQSLTFLRTGYGKAQIKKFGFSPDSWAQMTIQLAYHRLLKGLGQPRAGGTYEAATTRKFQHGRTEAIRVVSEESVRWCESMDAGNVAESQKLFRDACKVHGDDARAAGNGMGVDRHIFGAFAVVAPNLYDGGGYLTCVFRSSKDDQGGRDCAHAFL